MIKVNDGLYCFSQKYSFVFSEDDELECGKGWYVQEHNYPEEDSTHALFILFIVVVR